MRLRPSYYGLRVITNRQQRVSPVLRVRDLLDNMRPSFLCVLSVDPISIMATGYFLQTLLQSLISMVLRVPGEALRALSIDDVWQTLDVCLRSGRSERAGRSKKRGIACQTALRFVSILHSLSTSSTIYSYHHYHHSILACHFTHFVPELLFHLNLHIFPPHPADISLQRQIFSSEIYARSAPCRLSKDPSTRLRRLGKEASSTIEICNPQPIR